MKFSTHSLLILFRSALRPPQAGRHSTFPSSPTLSRRSLGVGGTAPIGTTPMNTKTTTAHRSSKTAFWRKLEVPRLFNPERFRGFHGSETHSLIPSALAIRPRAHGRGAQGLSLSALSLSNRSNGTDHRSRPGSLLLSLIGLTLFASSSFCADTCNGYESY